MFIILCVLKQLSEPFGKNPHYHNGDSMNSPGKKLWVPIFIEVFKDGLELGYPAQRQGESGIGYWDPVFLRVPGIRCITLQVSLPCFSHFLVSNPPGLTGCALRFDDLPTCLPLVDSDVSSSSPSYLFLRSPLCVYLGGLVWVWRNVGRSLA